MALAFGTLIVCVVVLVEVFFLIALYQYYYGTVVQTLVQESAASTRYFNQYSFETLSALAQRISDEKRQEKSYLDFQIIDLDNRVILDSYRMSYTTSLQTPDIQKALSGKVGIWKGEPSGSDETIIAVSNPIRINQQIVGVLRYSSSATELDQKITQFMFLSIVLALILISLSVIVSYWIAKRIVKPITDLTSLAKQIAAGNFLLTSQKHQHDEVGVLSETMNIMSQELRKNEQLKNEFISAISHELRTPLTSINGWIETIQEGQLEDREETELGLLIMKKESQRLTKLVENLLDFSHYQAGQMKLEKEMFSLSQLLTEIEKQFSRLSKKQNVTFEVKHKPDIELYADPNRIKQVLINLLDNAFKFTPVEGRVELTATEDSQTITVTVTDNGAGIEESEIKNITKRFYKASSKKKGSGLGLAICKEIIQLHEGQLVINSVLGKGTSISFPLPKTSQIEKT